MAINFHREGSTTLGEDTSRLRKGESSIFRWRARKLGKKSGKCINLEIDSGGKRLAFREIDDLCAKEITMCSANFNQRRNCCNWAVNRREM